MLTCFKLNFSLLGQKDNYFSYVYIFLFILDIILIIINEISLEKKIFNQMINYCKEYILKNNSNDDNLKNKEFKKLRNIYLNGFRDNTQLKKNFNKFKSQKILSNPVKRGRSLKNKINKEIEEKIAEENIIKETEVYFRQETKEEIENENDNEDSDNDYYAYLIFIYIKKDRKRFLIDEEINNLDFNLYKYIESRSIIEIYWSIFKTEYSLYSTFFIFNKKNKYKEYKLYIIKIIIYISSFTFSIIINILFYNGKTMHKSFEDDGTFILKYNLPRIIITDIAKTFFSNILKCLIEYQDDLIKLKKNLDVIDIEKIESNNSGNETKTFSNIKLIVKENKCISSIRSLNDTVKLNNKKLKHPIKNDFTIKKSVSQITDNNNDSNSNDNDNDTQIEYTNDNKRSEKTNEKEEMARNIEKRIKRNRIIFYYIILYFQLYSWYFISCFCALYKKTQKQLGKDIRLGMLANLISSLFISFYILIIRIIIIRGSFCNKIFSRFYHILIK